MDIIINHAADSKHRRQLTLCSAVAFQPSRPINRTVSKAPDVAAAADHNGASAGIRHEIRSGQNEIRFSHHGDHHGGESGPKDLSVSDAVINEIILLGRIREKAGGPGCRVVDQFVGAVSRGILDPDEAIHILKAGVEVDRRAALKGDYFRGKAE